MGVQIKNRFVRAVRAIVREELNAQMSREEQSIQWFTRRCYQGHFREEIGLIAQREVQRTTREDVSGCKSTRTQLSVLTQADWNLYHSLQHRSQHKYGPLQTAEELAADIDNTEERQAAKRKETEEAMRKFMGSFTIFDG